MQDKDRIIKLLPLWQRPPENRCDCSIVTAATLIVPDQTSLMPEDFTRTLNDQGCLGQDQWQASAGALDELLLPENKERLAALVFYLVAPGEMMSSDLADGQAAATISGAEVTFDGGNGMMVNEALITRSDTLFGPSN